MTRLAICGGPYSNPHALRAFVAQARARGADRLFCLGDFGAGQTDCGCGYTDDAFAAIAYDYTYRNTSSGFAAWIRTLPTEHRETIDGVDVHLVRGSTPATNDFWWESLTDAQHGLRVGESGADVICCTHSGLPWTRRFGNTLVVNVGVLGRPANDGGTHVWYAIRERWYPFLDADDPRDLAARDGYFRYFAAFTFTGDPLPVLIARLLRRVLRYPRILTVALPCAARIVRRGGGLRPMIRHGIRPVSFVVHQFMDAEDVTPAWEMMQRGEQATQPRLIATQQRLAACHYALAHPETGEIVPACVQHSVLDPVENIELRRLLPIVETRSGSRRNVG